MSNVKFSNTITFSQPIKRNGNDGKEGEEVTEVKLRKPSVGELRGLSMKNIMEMHVNEMLEIIPRISMPPLLKAEVEEMDPADFIRLADAVFTFFIPPEQLEVIQTAMGR